MAGNTVARMGGWAALETAANTVSRIGGAEAFCDFAGAAGIPLPSPFFAMVQRGRFDGESIVFALTNTVPHGRGVTLATANANKSAATGLQFLIRPLAPSSPHQVIMGRGDNQPVGIGDWIPHDAPTQAGPRSDADFCGVDRSRDITRLAGVRVHAFGCPMQEAIINALAHVGREGGQCDVLVVSSALRGRVDAETYGPRGIVRTLYDAGCDADTAFALQSDTWHLYVHDDGREALVCTAPGYNARIIGFGC